MSRHATRDERRRLQHRPGQAGHVVGAGQDAGPVVDQLGERTSGETGHRGPAGQRLGDDQPERLLPAGRDDGDARAADDVGHLGGGQVAEVVDAVTEAGGDLVGEVPVVVARTDQPQGQPGQAGGIDGEVGRLLRDQAATPHRAGPARPRPPCREVDTVADHVADRDAGPRRRVGVRDRDEPRRVALVTSEGEGGFQPRRRGRVQRAGDDGRQQRAAGEREVVDGVEVHELVAGADQAQHGVEVAVVLAQRDGRARRDVATGGVGGLEGDREQPLDVEAPVAVGGVDGDLVTASGQRVGQDVRVHLHATGERLADGEAGGGDDRHVHAGLLDDGRRPGRARRGVNDLSPPGPHCANVAAVTARRSCDM